MKPLLAVILLACVHGLVQATEYKLDYDYKGQGDDWYGRGEIRLLSSDYRPDTDILTQQGDDFCNGYLSKLVHFQQKPELKRTNLSTTSYDFYNKGGNGCVFDLIYKNGFE